MIKWKMKKVWFDLWSVWIETSQTRRGFELHNSEEKEYIKYEVRNRLLDFHLLINHNQPGRAGFCYDLIRKEFEND